MPVVWFGVLGLAAAGAATPWVERLDNGLTAIVLEDHTLPLVSVQLWYRVGSADDDPQWPGLCHVARTILEHREQAASRLRAAGIRFESGTLPDACYFHSVLPPDFLRPVLELEVRRASPLDVSPEMLADGLARAAAGGDARTGQAQDRPDRCLLQAVFSNHPYRYPSTFVAARLQDLPTARVNDFIRRWFVPGNATVLVVGDVSEKATLELLREHFGALPWSQPGRRREVPSPPVDRVHVSVPGDRAGLYVAWLTPPAGQFENAAIDVLMHRLCNLVDGRLCKRLRELGCSPPQWRREAWREHGWVVLSFAGSGAAIESSARVPGSGQAVQDHWRCQTRAWAEQVERAVREELDAMRAEPSGEIELNRARALADRDLLLRRETFSRRALEVGWYQVVAGDLLLADFARSQIAGVTVSDVRAAADLLCAARTVTLLRVAGDAQAAPAEACGETAAPLIMPTSARSAAQPATQPGSGWELSQPAAAAPPYLVTVERPAGGVEVVVLQIRSLPLGNVRTIATWRAAQPPDRAWRIPETEGNWWSAEQVRDYLSYHGLDLAVRPGLVDGRQAVLVSSGQGRYAAQLIEMHAALLAAACGESSDASPDAVRVIVVGEVDPGEALEAVRLAWADGKVSRLSSAAALSPVAEADPREPEIWRSSRRYVECLLELDSARAIADWLERGVMHPWPRFPACGSP